MDYLIIFLISLLSLKIYFFVAKKYEIIDKPNFRTMHQGEIVRGGGIIFLIISICYYFYQFHYHYFFVGLFLIGFISMIDDIKNVKKRYRLIFQFLSSVLIIIELDISNFGLIVLSFILILLILWINIFNFMDGINGLTGLYSLVLLTTLQYLNYHNTFVDKILINYLLISIIIFLFYNFRYKAKIFCGDVGSITLGFFVIYFLFKLIIQSNDYSYLIFISVYLIDGIMTLVERFFNRENIFLAHKKHLYQILVTKYQIEHIYVSFLYSFVQLAINFIWIYFDLFNLNNTILVVFFNIVSVIFYMQFKKTLLKK